MTSPQDSDPLEPQPELDAPQYVAPDSYVPAPME